MREIGKDSPAAAPALSQGLGGDTDAIIRLYLASGPVQRRWGEVMDLGTGEGVEVDRRMGDGRRRREGRKSSKSHVAGSGEAEDVGVFRPLGKSEEELGSSPRR